MLDDVGYGEGGGLDIVASLDDLEIRTDAAQVLVGLAVGQVTETEGLGDLSRREELLELNQGQRRTGRPRSVTFYKMDDRWACALCRVRLGADGGHLSTLAGMSRARSGIWISPMTRTRKAIVDSPQSQCKDVRERTGRGIGWSRYQIGWELEQAGAGFMRTSVTVEAGGAVWLAHHAALRGTCSP